MTDRMCANDFRLIDIGRFSAVTPVSRDPTKLMLSVATAWLPGLAPGTPLRSALAELLVTPDRFPASPSVAGYLAVMSRINRAAAQWGDQRRMPQEWARQHLLLLIGSALRTVADTDLPMADRWWFFEVAALATRAFGESVGPHPAHPTTPPTLAPAGSGAPPAPSTSHRSSADSSAPRIDPVPVPPRPARRGVSGTTYPGHVKVQFAQRIRDDWRDLADALDVPPYARDRFSRGHEPQELWEWLEVRDRLGELPATLAAIGRSDLAPMFTRPRAGITT